MKISNILILTVVIGFSAFANANSIGVRCAGESVQDCEVRTSFALTNMGCQVQSVKCGSFANIDESGNTIGEIIHCQTENTNCYETKPYLFDGVYCSETSKKETLSKYDRLLKLTKDNGLTKSWVHTICVD